MPADAGHAARACLLIGIGQGEMRFGVELDGGGFLLGDAEFFAQCADGGDEFLQDVCMAATAASSQGNRRLAESG